MSRNRRLLKYGVAAAVATTGVSLYMRESLWWSSLAPVRFGRAAAAVSPLYTQPLHALHL